MFRAADARRPHTLSLRACAVWLGLLWLLSTQGSVWAQEDVLANSARDVLRKYCAECHRKP